MKLTEKQKSEASDLRDLITMVMGRVDNLKDEVEAVEAKTEDEESKQAELAGYLDECAENLSNADDALSYLED